MEHIDLDRLNEAIKTAEDRIHRNHHTVPAWVPFIRGSHLGWKKLGREWCLAVQYAQDEAAHPLLNCPLEFRLAAAEHLASLEVALRVAENQLIVDVKEAIEAYKEGT
jgi:hypothetical protein